ncbi:LuxR C-terminal-related transcriptional regulator, partial [Arthrobacter sp. GCM10027362]|uniref:helix-turn-helix transcriptional regulator n=1 Tax=Arthrobacter sp. GCM10027362 TaxID=3273379 RepID=UPI0036441964
EALALAVQLARRGLAAADQLRSLAGSCQRLADRGDGGTGPLSDGALLIHQLAANTQCLSSPELPPEAEPALRELAGRRSALTDIRAAALALLAERLDASGRSIEAQRLAGQALTLLESGESGSLDLRAFVATRLMFALVHAGRYWQVEEHLDSFRGGREDSPSYLRGSAELFAALVSVRQGRLRQGLDRLIPAVEELRLADPETLLPYVLGLLAHAAAQLGERGLALKYAAQFQLLPQQGPQHRWLVAAAYAAAAKAARGGGEAAGQLAGLAADARNAGFLRCEKEILEVLCRTGATDQLHRLGQLAATFEGTEAGVGYRVAAARAAQDPEMLFDAARAAESVHHYADAAESLAAAVRIHARTGEARQAGVLRQRLNRLLHHVGGIATGSLAEAAEAAELTRREQEIVAMAAEGLSNREIAKRLYVSQRTVEGHLYRTFSKLGISQRQELGRVVSRLPSTIPTSRRTNCDS